MPGWQISFGNQVLTDENVTVGESATVLEIIHRPGWDMCDPRSSPDVLGAWCVVALMRGGTNIQDALIAINQSKLSDLAACISERQTEPPLPPPPSSNGQLPPELQEMVDRVKGG